MATSTWSGELPEADKEYYIAPKVNYKFEKLRKTTQQMPLNITVALELDGKPAGEKTETLQVRSINDCPFGVSNEEETLNDSGSVAGDAEIGWMFAAYVNENHPMLDKILQEALATKIANAFLGYQRDDPAEVMKQVFAIWSALQKRGIQYSSTTTTPGGSEEVYSQYVRFLDQSITNTQANCVDGSVLFASILRKISIQPFLVTVPGHMYMGFYLGSDKKDFVGLETTAIGVQNATDEEKSDDPKALDELARQARRKNPRQSRLEDLCESDPNRDGRPGKERSQLRRRQRQLPVHRSRRSPERGDHADPVQRSGVSAPSASSTPASSPTPKK